MHGELRKARAVLSGGVTELGGPYKPGDVPAMVRRWLEQQPDRPHFSVTRTQLEALLADIGQARAQGESR